MIKTPSVLIGYLLNNIPCYLVLPWSRKYIQLCWRAVTMVNNITLLQIKIICSEREKLQSLTRAQLIFLPRPRHASCSKLKIQISSTTNHERPHHRVYRHLFTNKIRFDNFIDVISFTVRVASNSGWCANRIDSISKDIYYSIYFQWYCFSLKQINLTFLINEHIK